MKRHCIGQRGFLESEKSDTSSPSPHPGTALRVNRAQRGCSILRLRKEKPML